MASVLSSSKCALTGPSAVLLKDYERIIQVILMSLPKDQALSLEDLIYTSAGGEGVAKEVADFVITYQQ